MRQLGVASNVHGLKRRLDAFVWDNRSTEAALLRRILDSDFGAFEAVGVVGGLVRDLARGGRAAFKSDVDLVVVAPTKDVAALASRVGATANRFGGYGYKSGPWSIDFWALESTWAAVAGHVAVSNLGDVVHCTFFDWDATVYDLRSRRVHCADGYLDRMRMHRLDIGLRSNPGEIGNLLRAARRILAWGLDPGPALRAFIEETLDDASFDSLKTKERRKHATTLVSTFSSADELRRALLTSRSHQKGAQMSLPLPA